MLINHIDFVVVLFYKENDPASKNAAIDVDSIDDNLKERGISIVKTKNKDQIEMLVFKELSCCVDKDILRYDIDVLPKLIYFESEIPTYWPDEVPLLGIAANPNSSLLHFPGNETILSWIGHCQDSDVIEDITEDMLEKLIANTDMIAVFFYNKREKGDYEDQLEGLETIDDDLDGFELPMVKISSKDIALDFGFEEIPSLAFFRKGVPAHCDVDLMDEGQVWIKRMTNDCDSPIE